MKGLNTSKIIGILATLLVFFIAFNYIQNKGADFEVDSNTFDVLESSEEFNEKVSGMMPQMELAKELGTLHTFDKSIPVLEHDRELRIHDAMLSPFGGLYLSYSFSMKEEDQPFDLPALSVGSVSYEDSNGKIISENVQQRSILLPEHQKPLVIQNRVYHAAILTPNIQVSEEDMRNFIESNEITLKEIKVTQASEKRALDDITLSLPNTYAGKWFAEADLDAKAEVEGGSIHFTKFNAGFEKNELIFSTDLSEVSHLLVKEKYGDRTFQSRYKVHKKGGEYSVYLNPFQKYQKEIEIQLIGIIKNHDGTITSTITSEELKRLKGGGTIITEAYSGITYSIEAMPSGSSDQMVIKLEGESEVYKEEAKRVYMISQKEYKENLKQPQDDNAIFSLKDRNEDNILIYSINYVEDEVFVNLDMGHLSSLSPATLKLSNLPTILPGEGTIKAFLTKVRKK